MRPVKGDSELVLLVDDEETVRMIAARILTENGYRVLVASGPEEALEIYGEYGSAIDLVITDMVMPGATGVELMKEIWSSRPAAKGLFISGYTDRGPVADGQVEEDLHFLAKPFGVETLTRKVREVLDSG